MKKFMLPRYLLSSALIVGIIISLASCNTSSINVDSLSLQTLKGKEISLKKYQGKKVFLTFWASWCGPCLKEMPGIEVARKELRRKGYEFVMISDEEIEKISGFLARNNYSSDFLHSTQSIKGYGVFSIPQTYILDESGEVLASFSTGRDWGTEENIKLLESY